MTREPVTYQAYELVDLEGRSVINTPAPGVQVVLASDHDAVVQQLKGAEEAREHYANLLAKATSALASKDAELAAVVGVLEQIRDLELARPMLWEGPTAQWQHQQLALAQVMAAKAVNTLPASARKMLDEVAGWKRIHADLMIQVKWDKAELDKLQDEVRRLRARENRHGM